MSDKDYTISSDNVFADLGLPDAEERLTRAQLLIYIINEVSRRDLTQRQAASLLGIPQPHVSYLLQARLSCFSLERLLQMMARLGLDVAISCQPATGEQGHVTIKLPQTA
jgi:predicted XRE-type DNA-binding protein